MANKLKSIYRYIVIKNQFETRRRPITRSKIEGMTYILDYLHTSRTGEQSTPIKWEYSAGYDILSPASISHLYISQNDKFLETYNQVVSVGHIDFDVVDMKYKEKDKKVTVTLTPLEYYILDSIIPYEQEVGVLGIHNKIQSTIQKVRLGLSENQIFSNECVRLDLQELTKGVNFHKEMNDILDETRR